MPTLVQEVFSDLPSPQEIAHLIREALKVALDSDQVDSEAETEVGKVLAEKLAPKERNAAKIEIVNSFCLVDRFNYWVWTLKVRYPDGSIVLIDQDS
jgi:hypothetical protein